MNKGNALITAGGCVLVCLVTFGSGVFVRNVINDLHVQQGASLADSSSLYEENYTYAMAVQLFNAASDDDASSDDSVGNVTNVQIIHNDEVVSDVVVLPSQTVTVDITVEDDEVSVVVSDPVPSDEITELPRIIDGETIYLSDVTETLEDGTVIYHIQKGDTLCYISTLLGYSVDELAEYNHIENVNLIYADSVLRVPNWAASP